MSLFDRRTLALTLVAALTLGACQTQTAAPTETAETTAATTNEAASTDTAETDATTDTVATAEVGLFDASTVHEVSISYDEAEYEAMIETLATTGEKEWLTVTVTIDGVTYENAGARLKGNSTLRGLTGSGAGDGAAPAEAPGGRGGGGPNNTASADEPESLPWLIRLDEFVDGQNHQGYVDLVVRANNSETALNEAVALDLLEATGLASEDAASVAFSINGGDATLRLMIEHPSDDEWQDTNFDGDGALYKAESGGDWSYRGDDQSAYDDVFDQEGGKKVTDLTPLIDFLAFVNESDDATFADELSDHLDVDAFATYLAMMELLDNFDDIDGPGNNAYLWWDEASGQFTVVPWDLNLAFGSLGGGGGNGGRGPSGTSNILVERFHANADFEALYEQKLADLQAELFDSGVAADLLAERIAVLLAEAGDLVDAATVTSDAAAITASIAA